HDITSRTKDRQIDRFTPDTQVKKILDERFYAEWKAAVSNWMLRLPLTAGLQAYHDNASWT
ncbi:MAG: hypothetical protein MP439_09960, partial [Ferrimicrobium sp.]|nr:hypothetical protein [Ferrimicrobium sp.]